MVDKWCNARYASCRCENERDHEGSHECSCGGAWEDRLGAFKIVRWPGGMSTELWKRA